MQKFELHINKPAFGWSGIYIKDEQGQVFQGSLSYVDNVMYDLLHACQIYLQEDVRTAVEFDEEGTSYVIVIDPLYIRVMVYRDTEYMLRLWVDDDEFIESVCDEFEANLDDWVRFCYLAEEDEENFESDKAKYIAQIAVIRGLLKAKREERERENDPLCILGGSDTF